MTATAPHRLTILGVTGSIGASTLRIVSLYPERFALQAITAQDNVEKLIEICLSYHPKHAVIGNVNHYARLKDALAHTSITVAAGQEAICDAASLPADTVVAAIVGIAGLAPTLRAIEQGTRVALANKESLVSAGHIMMQSVARHDATLLPVDSEHNAIFQILHTPHNPQLEKITLTASGGPFRHTSLEKLHHITPAEAIAHPKWSMGAKISVDSATLMNKGLELIEASHLFALPPEQLDCVIHPQSIIHGLAHYSDGSVLAHMALPDMITPLASCLAWPDRMSLDIPKLDLMTLGTLEFEAPDRTRFPCLLLAYAAMQAGGAAPVILNAANEMAVAAFLSHAIGFMDISKHIAYVLHHMHDYPAPTSLEDVMHIDSAARSYDCAASCLHSR